MQSLFENRRQALKVRLWLLASLIVCLGTLYGSASIYQSYGLSPGDGGALRAFGERLALAGFVALLGLMFPAAMMVYASLYVLRVDLRGNQLFLDTITPWGVGVLRHEISTDSLTSSRYHHGRFSVRRGTGSPGRSIPLEVDAPWITISSEGRRLPFLLDVQAEHIDVETLSKLIRTAMADWESDRG